MNVVRYFHIRPAGVAGNPRGGATVRVEGEIGARNLNIQVSECSVKDNFCRKTGREVAASKPTLSLMVDNLPILLEDIQKIVNKRRYRHVDFSVAIAEGYYTFSTKYWKVK